MPETTNTRVELKPAAKKRMRIIAPPGGVLLADYADDTRNPFEVDLTEYAGCYLVVEVFDAGVNRFVEVLTVTLPGVYA